MLAQLDLNNLPWGWVITLAITVVGAIGVGIAYLVSRAYVSQTIKILQATIETHEKNLKAKDELALSLAATSKEITVSLEAKLTAMTEERDNYRRDLHANRGELTAANLKIQEFELRPDLNQVLKKEEAWHARREEFYTAMSQNQAVIITVQRDTIQLIGEIKNNVDAELKQSNEVCAQVGKALQELIEKMDAREEAAAERDKGMMEMLKGINSHLRKLNGPSESAT